jgi:hypothetical protein
MNLDTLTANNSVFATFAELLDAKGGYRPTIHLDSADKRALADAYDAEQAARGDTRRAYRRPAADEGDDAAYELRILDGEAFVLTGRACAEECLRQFAQGGGYDVHIHPTVYTDGSRSTAFRRGGDSLYDAQASLRRLF